jgi:para-nitrobenzyl esterase
MLLKQVGLDRASFRKLQDLPMQQIIDAQAKMEQQMRPGPRRGFVPTAGTPDLPWQPVEAVAAGKCRKPLIIGSVMHEMALFLAGMGMKPADVDEAKLTQMAGAFFGDKAAELVAGYKANHPDYTPGDIMVRMWSDSMRLGEIELAEAQAKAGLAPAYMYLFHWESPVLPWLKSAHGIDGSFYFGNTQVLPITENQPTARVLSHRTSTAWATFAATGTPSAPGLPQWPAYTLDKRETMILEPGPHIESDPMGKDRELRVRLTGYI